MRLGAARRAAGLDVSGCRKPASVSAFHRRQRPPSCADQIVDGVKATKPAARLMSAARRAALRIALLASGTRARRTHLFSRFFRPRYDGATGAACWPTVSDPAVLLPPGRSAGGQWRRRSCGLGRPASCSRPHHTRPALRQALLNWAADPFVSRTLLVSLAALLIPPTRAHPSTLKSSRLVVPLLFGALVPGANASGNPGSPPNVFTGLTCVLHCLVLACVSLLWTRRHALSFGLKSYRGKPSCLSEARASRWSPAGSLAPGGRTGVVRRASLLLLVPWLAVCSAAGPICSNEPTVCDGTYSGTTLCALPTSLSPPLRS